MALVETARFPTALATEADMLQWRNYRSTDVYATLSAGINSSVTTIGLTAGLGASLPADSFVVTIDDEIIYVGSRSSDTLNSCVRGYEGTSAASHNTGAQVTQRLTAKSHNQIVAEIKAIETELGANLSKVKGLNTISPFTATPSFDGGSYTSFKMTLTGNVTSSSMTNLRAGVVYTFQFVQDGTGGRSLVWPSNVKNGMTIDSSITANTVCIQSFFCDGINCYALGPGMEN